MFTQGEVTAQLVRQADPAVIIVQYDTLDVRHLLRIRSQLAVALNAPPVLQQFNQQG